MFDYNYELLVYILYMPSILFKEHEIMIKYIFISILLFNKTMSNDSDAIIYYLKQIVHENYILH